MYKHSLSIFLLLICFGPFALGQCLTPVDTLFYEDFESGIPDSWELVSGKDGSTWELSATGFGEYKNPGMGNWIYLADQAGGNSGNAQVITNVYDLSAHKNFAELSFSLNFQEFANHGKFKLEVRSNDRWVTLYETTEDIEGKVIIDMKSLVDTHNQFRFTYEIDEIEGWGVGVDNFLLTGAKDLCGNNICDLGENPETCPGDCPRLTNFPQTWVPVEKDIFGEAALYSPFEENRFCDDCSQEIALGFDFQFYEYDYPSVFINSNGNVSFGEDFVNFVPQAFCLQGPAMIAPYFSDVDLSKGGRISFYQDPDKHYVIINWMDVAFFGCGSACDLRNTYQLILTDGSIHELNGVLLPKGSNVIINYGDMQWTGGVASGGYGGFGGQAATVGINSGEEDLCAPYGTFDKAGFSFHGKLHDGSCQSSGVDHLDFSYLFFNTSEGELAQYKGISKLEGTSTEEGIRLNWWIDYIKEDGLFIIERLVETGEYEEVSKIRINLDQFESLVDTYEFVDRNIQQGEHKYRIKYEGKEGESYQDSLLVSFVSPKELAPGPSDFTILSYGPNPLEDYLEVSLGAEEALSITYELLDMSGSLYKAGKVDINGLSQSFRIRTQDLSSGLYVLSIRSRLAKQHVRLEKK